MSMSIKTSCNNEDMRVLESFVKGKEIKDINLGKCNNTTYAKQDDDIGAIFIFFTDGSSLRITQENSEKENPLDFEYWR